LLTYCWLHKTYIYCAGITVQCHVSDQITWFQMWKASTTWNLDMISGIKHNVIHICCFWYVLFLPRILIPVWLANTYTKLPAISKQSIKFIIYWNKMRFLHGEWHASQRHSHIPSACSNLFCQGSSFPYESPTTEQTLMKKWKGYLIPMKFINSIINPHKLLHISCFPNMFWQDFSFLYTSPAIWKPL
jgi:hypothetical protein